jgi:predicted AAA+ superfamily ATPase
MVSPLKVYSIDTGLSNAIGFRFTNFGRCMENFVSIELQRRYKKPVYEIFYWKDQDHEVDFVLKEGLSVKELIQVTYASSKEEIEKRELQSLIKAADKLKCNNLLVITWDYEDKVSLENRKIVFKPLWKWLFQKEDNIRIAQN